MWLWIVGPALAALVFLLTDRRDKRREAEVDRWLAGMADAKPVSGLPGPLNRLVLAAGGGKRLRTFELVPKLAYLAEMGADSTTGSDHHTLAAKLDEGAPTFTVRPLPILDGQREPNTGVQFKKDPEFMDAFLVERALEGAAGAAAPADEATDKAIRKWLSPEVRAALLELPDAWLRVDGKTMSLTLYGPTDAEKLNDLVTCADVVFAEYGAEGGPSLFGDDEEGDESEPTPPPKKSGKVKPAGAKKPGAGKAA